MQESKRHDVGAVIPVEFAQRMYKERGIALIVTDGRYVQIEKEPTPTK